MFKSLINFFTSLRLTVVCLCLAIVLVFVGTLAQVKLGLYVTQERYFRSLFVLWTPQGTDWRIPVWPGGYLLGWLLVVNLIAAHIKRFKFSWKKSGIFLTHGGLIFLLCGQFLTEMSQIESFMRIEEGQAKNYSEDGRKHEVAVVDVSAADKERVVAIPESLVRTGGEIRHPQLPFTLRFKEHFANSFPGGPMTKSETKRLKAAQGAGQLAFDEAPITARMNDENRPSVLVEAIGANGASLGEWAVSVWSTKYSIPQLTEWFGAQLAGTLAQPQQLSYEGRHYEIALRPVRYYKPYSVQLLDFTHARYRGTEIPKDFSSRIRLVNAQTGEDREVLIYMNNPLRYAGETYYQGGFEPSDTVSVLQVVRNPAWLTPYFACVVIAGGMLVQFLMHLFGFFKRTSQRNTSKLGQPRASTPKRQNPVEPATVNLVSSGNGKLSHASTKRRTS
jgi:hypothetical protein